MEEQKNTLLTKFKNLVPEDPIFFDSTEEYETAMEYMIDCSIEILMNTLYPFEDWSDYNIPKSKYNWVIRCAVELYNMADRAGYKSYSENGLSWSKDTDGLSKSLMSDLISHIGTPTEDEETTEEETTEDETETSEETEEESTEESDT